MKNYNLKSILDEPRTELHDALQLNGAEISFNHLPKGGCVPFCHHHKNNEEIYIILSGNGYVIIDDEKVLVKESDTLRISPSAKRQFFASNDSDLKFICIQVRENSLKEYTESDAIID